MHRSISISLPINVNDYEKHLFEPFITFSPPKVKIKYLKNVFITPNGFCINKTGLVKESHHAYPAQYAGYLKEASHYYYDAIDHPENLLLLEDQNRYLLIHHPWFMYYHWLCESICRLWLVKDQLDDLTLLLPEGYAEIDFVKKTLLPFGLRKIRFIPENKSIMVSNLCLPQIKPLIESYDREQLLQIRNFYLSYVSEHYKHIVNLGKKLYISREKASRKKIANESELFPLLEKYGFTVIYNEDYDFFEQVSIFSEAQFLISIHGSGLTNMLFMPKGSVILEFQKRLTNPGDWHSVAFWSLAAGLSHNYYHQICEPTDINADYFTADYIVDVELFEDNLRLMLETKSIL